MDLKAVTRTLDVRKTLDAFASLLTQEIDQQDLPTSLKTATKAIGLGTLPGFALLIRHGVRTAGELVVTSIVLVLGWMVFTAILSRDRKLEMARNLNLLSFWIAATLVLVLLADFLFDDPLQRMIRFLSVAGALVVFVPIHLFRSARSWSILWRMPALCLTMGLLAWSVIY